MLSKLEVLEMAENKAWELYKEASKVRQAAEEAEDAASDAWNVAFTAHKVELRKLEEAHYD
jgi:cation transport regulator ChaB